MRVREFVGWLVEDPTRSLDAVVQFVERQLSLYLITRAARPGGEKGGGLTQGSVYCCRQCR